MRPQRDAGCDGVIECNQELGSHMDGIMEFCGDRMVGDEIKMKQKEIKDRAMETKAG